MDLVRWPRKGRKAMTKLHADAYAAHDTEGRTHCGLTYPRRDAEYRQDNDDQYCRNCERAVKVIPRRRET